MASQQKLQHCSLSGDGSTHTKVLANPLFPACDSNNSSLCCMLFKAKRIRTAISKSELKNIGNINLLKAKIRWLKNSVGML